MSCPDCTAPEEWRDVVGYEGLYQVSSRGGVRSIERRDRLGRRVGGHAMRPGTRNRGGYLSVDLCRSGSIRKSYVHRLVSECFHGPCPRGREAAHGDGDPTHNCRSNLRWASRAGNNHDKRAHGTMRIGESNNKAKLTEESVREIRRLCAGGVRQRVMAERFGVAKGIISAVVNRKTWRHVG